MAGVQSDARDSLQRARVVIETSRGDLSFFVPGGQVIVSAEPTQDAPVDGRVAVVVWDQDECNSLVALPRKPWKGLDSPRYRVDS